MSLQIQEDCIGLALNPSLSNPVTGLPIDLTEATEVLFIIQGPQTDQRHEETGDVDGDPTLGKVVFANTSFEFTSAGIWKYQVKVTFSDGQVFFSVIGKIKVKANI